MLRDKFKLLSRRATNLVNPRHHKAMLASQEFYRRFESRPVAAGKFTSLVRARRGKIQFLLRKRVELLRDFTLRGNGVLCDQLPSARVKPIVLDSEGRFDLGSLVVGNLLKDQKSDCQ